MFLQGTSEMPCVAAFVEESLEILVELLSSERVWDIEAPRVGQRDVRALQEKFVHGSRVDVLRALEYLFHGLSQCLVVNPFQGRDQPIVVLEPERDRKVVYSGHSLDEYLIQLVRLHQLR